MSSVAYDMLKIASTDLLERRSSRVFCPTSEGLQENADAVQQDNNDMTSSFRSSDDYTIYHSGAMSLFKKFEPKPDLGPATALKSSVRRVIRGKLTEQYPALAKDDGALLEAAWPNKASVTTVKFAREHVQMLIADKQVLFFQHYDDWYLPSLRLLHKCECPCDMLLSESVHG